MPNSNTAQNVNGIVFDLNRITRRDFKRFLAELETADDESKDVLTAEFFKRVVVSWPFGDVTEDVYLELGMVDAQAVDNAFQEAAAYLGEKNSARQYTYLADTTPQ